MDNYNKACTELINILEYLSEEEYSKIPEKVIGTIINNVDEEYEYEIGELDFDNCEMLEETKAMLFNIYRDYLCSPEQKQKIINYQNKERAKDEAKKQEKYDKFVFNIKEKEEKKENVENTKKVDDKEKYLIKKEKENIVIKFINFLKNIFKNNIRNKL